MDSGDVISQAQDLTFYITRVTPSGLVVWSKMMNSIKTSTTVASFVFAHGNEDYFIAFGKVSNTASFSNSTQQMGLNYGESRCLPLLIFSEPHLQPTTSI
jgi:hypothetical protein